MPFKDISYLELWWPFCSAEWNHLCNLVEGITRKNSEKNILNLDQWFRRCHLKDFSSGTVEVLLFSGAEPFVQF